MSDRISVTLITRNRPQYFIGCFSSLLSQTYTNWDAVIIDDSEPPLRENETIKFLIKVAREQGHDIQLIANENLGICQAWQRGLELAKPESEFGQRLEDDIWLHQDYLKHLHSLIITGKKIGGVGGLAPNVWNFNRIDTSEFKNFFYMEKGGFIPEDRQCCFIKNPLLQYSVTHLHGLFLYRKEVIQAVGGFATHMTRVGHRDETDLTLRMYYANYDLLVCPKAWLFHAQAPGGGSRDDLTVIERTKLQEQDEVAFQERFRYLREKYPHKKLPMKTES